MNFLWDANLAGKIWWKKTPKLLEKPQKAENIILNKIRIRSAIHKFTWAAYKIIRELFGNYSNIMKLANASCFLTLIIFSTVC